MLSGSVVTTWTGASTENWPGATLGDRFSQETWPAGPETQGAHQKEMQAVDRALNFKSDSVKDKLLLARMQTSLAVSPAKYGAGRLSAWTVLAQGIKGSEIAIP